MSDGPFLVPVLGDQLSLDLGSLRAVDKGEAVVLMMEVADETTYVKHHKVKIAFLLSAMRHHAAALEDEGWTVDYVEIRHAESLAVAHAGDKDLVVLAAARLGGTRLIDNVEVSLR